MRGGASDYGEEGGEADVMSRQDRSLLLRRRYIENVGVLIQSWSYIISSCIPMTLRRRYIENVGVLHRVGDISYPAVYL